MGGEGVTRAGWVEAVGRIWRGLREERRSQIAHLPVGVDVCDWGGEDGVAERGHGLGQLRLDCHRDLVLGGEDVVQLYFGNRRAHDYRRR
eukprot:scaffold27268_cov110-Isochrysis_galbana.AAC.1